MVCGADSLTGECESKATGLLSLSKKKKKWEQLTHCDHVASIPGIHSPSSEQIPNPQWCVNKAPSQRKQDGEAGLRHSPLLLQASELTNGGPQGCWETTCLAMS